MTQDEQFNEFLPRIRIIVNKRRGSWTLSTLAWEDVESILITRIYQKLPLYNKSQPFDNWANRLISRALSNLLRDNIFKHSRPCIAANPSGGACAFNEGGDRCGFTSNGKQCSLCPLYEKWQRKKESAHNINASLPLDHHDMEVQNIQEDFIDIERAKKIIDTKILSQLDVHDAEIYKLLFIQHLSMEEVSKKMGYRVQNNSKVGQVLRKLVTRFKLMAKEAIDSEDII